MMHIEQKTKFFEKKVPFGSNKLLLEKALNELGLQNEPVSKIDLNRLSQKMVELHNQPISDALKEQQEDYKQGFLY